MNINIFYNYTWEQIQVYDVSVYVSLCHPFKSLINVNWSTVSWCSTKAEVVGFLRSQCHFPYGQRTAYTGTAECEAKTSPSAKKSKNYEDACMMHQPYFTPSIPLDWSIFLVQDVLQKYWPALRNTNTISLWRATASRSLRLTSRARPHLSLFDYRSPTPTPPVLAQMSEMVGIDLINHPQMVAVHYWNYIMLVKQ
jgi:hypothetical protein